MLLKIARHGFLPALLLGLASAVNSAVAQSLEAIPGFAKFGPDADYYEVYQGDPIRLDFSLPGLTHEQSVANPGVGIPLFVYSAAALPFPIPFQPTANLWLDPATLQVIPINNQFELNVNFTSAVGLDVTLPAQVAVLTLLPADVLAETSDLIQIRFLTSLPPIDDEMRPLGVHAVGTESVAFDAVNNAYRLSFNDGVDPVDYVIALDLLDNQQGVLRIDELFSGMQPVRNGGFWYVRGSGSQVILPSQYKNIGTHTLTNHFVSGNTVTLEYRDEFPNANFTANVVNNRAFEITLRGRSLEVRGRDLDSSPKLGDTYFGFSLGNILWGPNTTVDQVRIPYMDQIGILMIGSTRFVSTFIDLFNSPAQSHSPASLTGTSTQASYTETTFYQPGTDGLSPAVDEKGFVTISGDVEDCFVETSAPRSANADASEELVAVALTTLPQNNAYVRDRGNINRMVSWGFDKVLAWKFHWMHFGLNKRATTHAPANPAGGTEADFVSMTQTAIDAGWRLALYSDFYSLDQAPIFDDNPNYKEGPVVFENFGDGVVGQDGEFLQGFESLTIPGTPGSGSYFTRLLSPLRSLEHFRREAAVLLQNYSINAHAFDVASIGAPDLIVTGDLDAGPTGNTTGNIDYDHESSNDKSIREAIQSYKNLFQQASLIVDGPVIGEGGFSGYARRFDSFYAGYIDGLWRTLTAQAAPNEPGAGNQSELVLPDYEIRHVRPKMAGLFGLGEYERFFEMNPNESLPLADIGMYELRATQIAYMHNGYLISTSKAENTGDFLTWAQQIKEYYTMISLSTEWKDAGQGTVSYRQPAVGSPWLSLSSMLKQGNYDFRNPVLRVSYPSGLTMTINHAPQTIFEGAFQIPRFGWVIENPNTGYRNLAVLDPSTGQRYELVEAPDYVYGDANGLTRDFGGALGLITDLKVVRFDKGFSLIEESNGDITKL